MIALLILVSKTSNASNNNNSHTIYQATNNKQIVKVNIS